MNLFDKIMLKLIQKKVERWFALECSLTSLKDVCLSAGDSPEKSWPDPSKIPGGEEVPFSLKNLPVVGHHLKSSIEQGVIAIRSIADNPKKASCSIGEDALKEFEAIAKSEGIGVIGYTKLPPHLIFRDRAVLFDRAIVLIMEMDHAAVAKAPSIDTFRMVMETYDKLGKTTNLLTAKLRQMGYQAQASHPLGGLTVYPPLAVKAGLGWFGRHGLLITPQFGPRQRISAIFVNIDNLPVVDDAETHSWIGDYCDRCGKCIKKCPSGAILEHPIEHNSGRKTCIDRDRCLPVFVKQQGCTVCVKECIFSNSTYMDIRDKYSV